MYKIQELGLSGWREYGTTITEIEAIHLAQARSQQLGQSARILNSSEQMIGIVNCAGLVAVQTDHVLVA